MMTKKKIPKKPLKDVNSAERTYFLRVLMLFLQYGLIALPVFLFKFGWTGAVLWLLICLSLAVVVEFFTNTLGTIAGRLYTGRKGSWSIREQMMGSLDGVRVQKMKGNHEQAMIQVDQILAKDPDFSDAIFVKAQLLYECFGDSREALRYLSKVIELTPENEPVYRWALSLKRDIDNRGKGQQK